MKPSDALAIMGAIMLVVDWYGLLTGSWPSTHHAGTALAGAACIRLFIEG